MSACVLELEKRPHPECLVSPAPPQANAAPAMKADSRRCLSKRKVSTRAMWKAALNTTWLRLCLTAESFLRKTLLLRVCQKKALQRASWCLGSTRPSSLAGKKPRRPLPSGARSCSTSWRTTACRSVWSVTPTSWPIRWAAPLPGPMPTAAWTPAAPCSPCTGMCSSSLGWSASRQGPTALMDSSSRKCLAILAGCARSWVHVRWGLEHGGYWLLKMQVAIS